MNTQQQFDKIFWELVRALPRKTADITSSFKEEFFQKLQNLQTLIDEGANINIIDSRSGSSYLETSIWNSTFISERSDNPYYRTFSQEILYFLLFQESLRPTIATVHVAASICRNPKITEEVLKRCDDAVLSSLRNGSDPWASSPSDDFLLAFDFLDPPIIEVFKGFRLK